jgi:putative ABC transport system permease protein
MSLWSRIANLFRNDGLSREIDDELQSHIEEAIEQGRDPAEARRAFGSALRRREESRDVRIVPWLDSLRADAVFGWRQLMKRKVTSAAAILSLALAIGACTSAFRLIDALLLRPLPVANPDRLYAVAFENLGPDGKTAVYDSCSYPTFRQMLAMAHEQADLIAVSYAERSDLTYGSDLEMEKAYRQFVSGRMFGAFGLRPVLGRLLTENDDDKPGASPYAVLSYDYWTRRLGQDRNVVGRTFRMGDTQFEIAGVLAEGFTGTETGTETDIFLPMAMKNPRTLASANNFWLRTMVLLKPGVAAEPLHQMLSATHRAAEQERTKSFTAVERRRDQARQEKLLLEPAGSGRSNLQRDYLTALTALGILVALVLLIACANVANLMTAQAASRAREMALRISIGATRRRLTQLVLMESIWLAFIAAAVGGLFAWWAAPFIIGMIDSPENPARLVLPADWRVLGFGLALALGVTFVLGLAPALRASAIRPASVLKGGEDPHAHRRLMHALIAVQIAFCFVVHFAAGLFSTTFDRLSHQPTGFSAQRILNLEAVAQRPQTPVYWQQALEHLRATPGIETAALTVWPLMSGESAVGDISIDSGAPSDVYADFLNVSPGWIDTMKIPLLGGRDFLAGEVNPAVAIVNQSFAKQYFDGENPVGKWFERVGRGDARSRIQVVGFVGDARSRDDMRRPIRPTAYVPFQSIDAKGAFQPMSRGTFVVRTFSANPVALASILRREVTNARAEIRVSNIRTQTEIDQAHTVRERLLAMLGVFFAGIALLLAGVGLYGVLDYSVLLRRKEIGIRMAIGAQAGGIARLVANDVLAMVAAGALAGLGLGLVSVRYIESLFFQVSATDPAMLAIPSIAITGATLLAALPAVIHAVRIDPVTMLRSE